MDVEDWIELHEEATLEVNFAQVHVHRKRRDVDVQWRIYVTHHLLYYMQLVDSAGRVDIFKPCQIYGKPGVIDRRVLLICLLHAVKRMLIQ